MDMLDIYRPNYLVKTILYNEFRKRNNPFTKGGKPYFTGGLQPTVYTIVHNYIDDYFYNYYIGVNNQERFLHILQHNLKRIEYQFFTMLVTSLNDKGIIFDETILNPEERERFFSGEDGQQKTWLKSDSRENIESDTTADTEAHVTSHTDTTGENFSRGLNSITPQSNLSNDIKPDRASINQPISWKYASTMDDAYNESKGTSDTTTDSTSHATEHSTTQDDITQTTNTGAKQRTDYRSVRYRDRYRDIDVHLKVKEYLTDLPNLWEYLTENLKRCFLYLPYFDL